MSITVSTDIFCDKDGCGHWVYGVTGMRSDKNGAQAKARQQGWYCSTRRDLCPACAKAEAVS